MESGNLLEIKDLHVHYFLEDETAKAVNGVSLHLKKGEVLGLVGETGAGKTTIALSILRLLPAYSSNVPSGEILFQGKDLLKADEKEMRTIRGGQISMIFQDPMTSLNPLESVGNQVADVIRLHNPDLNKAQVREQVDHIFELIGIPKEREKEYPHQFSGGMRQRIMIAIAVACNPQLLIADEPTTALDVTIQAQVIKIIRDLQSQMKSSVLFITHDLGLVANLCDYVAVIYTGEIVEYGTLEEVFDRQRPHHPYTIGLFQSIPKLDSKAERLTPIPGLAPSPSKLPEGCHFAPRCACRKPECEHPEIPVFTDGTHMIRCWCAAVGGNKNE